MLGRVWLALALGLAGCAGAPGTSAGEGATASGEATSSATGSSTSTTSVMTSDGVSSTSSTSSTGSTATDPASTGETSMGCTFLCGPDLGVDDCDPWLQDCPEGEKCNAWAKTGPWQWNSNKCVPVARDPDAVGEPCSVVESSVSGIDSCEHGAMCWDVDPKTLMGTCVALCVGSEDQCSQHPVSCCPPWAACTIASGGNLLLCLATCHPLIQNCEGQGDFCYPAEDLSLCVPDASGDAGQPGDPCEAMNACDPGTYCGDPKTYPGCDLMAVGCCIPFCDLLAPECAPGSVCQPYFENNATPAGFDDLGACVIP